MTEGGYVRLIWDFRGPDSRGTAEHHAIHLNQFAQSNGIAMTDHGSQAINEMHHMAFMIVQRKDMLTVRDALRPHRATEV
ncbi:MAG: hypothetical protein HKN79_07690 [Flavobacteriales bacterium]|nr:hypothetical protein [Flavobacteriales bacterium]